MPLQVSTNLPLAQQVYNRVFGLNSRFYREAGMGGFWVVQNTAEETAIGTCGAGPCQIILMHKGLGWGALGHYAADYNPNRIMEGVQHMLFLLGGGPIQNVVLAAGDSEAEYQFTITGRIRSLCPGVRITWAVSPDGESLGSCYYLPRSEQAGLFVDAPDDCSKLVVNWVQANGFRMSNYVVPKEVQMTVRQEHLRG